MSLLTYIPARGGSKGIRKKNLSKIGNKRLIDFTLEAAKRINKESFIFISTDDVEIFDHCKKKGFDIEYLRPSIFSSDSSLIVDGLLDALEWLKTNKNLFPTDILLLQPTSPFRNINQINECIEKYNEQNEISCVGVSKILNHPRKSLLIEDNSWKFLKSDSKQIANRQFYENNYYYIDGSFYLSKTSFIEKNKSFVVESVTKPYPMNHKYYLDIDEEEDLDFARAIYDYKIKNE